MKKWENFYEHKAQNRFFGVCEGLLLFLVLVKKGGIYAFIQRSDIGLDYFLCVFRNRLRRFIPLKSPIKALAIRHLI